jgi:two-component system OmpR family response regulator
MLRSNAYTNAAPHLVGADHPGQPSPGEWSGSSAHIHPTRVLCIDSDESMHQRLADFLTTHAMWVRTSTLQWSVVERLLATEAPDVVIIELPQRGNDWIGLLHRSRSHSSAPAIIATGQATSEAERVSALEVGADAYVVKPYGLRELVARIRAIVRRSQIGRNAALRRPHWKSCRFGGWELDGRTRCLTAIDGTQPKLTKGEYALLMAFLNAAECPLTREQLLNAIRVHEDVFDRVIDVRVLRLRRKLATSRHMPETIRTVRGVGYSLAVPVEWV